MKTYLVFAGDDFYPEGGWEDFVASFDDWPAALACAKEQAAKDYQWAQVVDTKEPHVTFIHAGEVHE